MGVTRFNMEAWLDRTNLVVCVGAGGVGKTTTAATLGLCGALRGRRVMVLTIDPARRLANSLGLKNIGNEQTQIDLEALGLSTDGELWAMMLDSRSTFDGLITRVSPDEVSRDRILNNHVYRHMADTFAGSQDYMATETLYDLVDSGSYDLIVLDTPPVKNALDFLESPGRLINFMDERVLRWFLHPYDANAVFGGKLMMGTSAVVFRLLAYVFGRDFLEDLATFFQDFQGLYEGFVARNDAVVKLFRDPGTSFVTICAPTESSLDVAVFFQEELKRRELPRGGIIVNQVHTCEGEQHDAKEILGALTRTLSEDLSPNTAATLLARLGMAHRRLRALGQAEAALARRVRACGAGGGFYQEIPRLDGNVHDLESLHEVGRRLLVPADVL
ncbi:MAG TPA: ArsA family ATPase [Deltaproteobacteria bacterium]|nr:ArsA family ATPase [Deltaproteobacteria bacterium]